MIWNPQQEAALLRRLHHNSDAHLVLDETSYTASRTRVLITVDGLTKSLTRHLYELLHGPLTMRYLLRVCDIALCVNPNHFIESHAPRLASDTYRKPVPNKRRDPLSYNKTKTHCPAGHEYTPENTYYQKVKAGHTSRSCITCRRQHNLEYAERRRNRAHADRRTALAQPLDDHAASDAPR